MAEAGSSLKTQTTAKEGLVAHYKRLLQATIDRRPSGMRLKIAEAIGKHKSFVSQITNPAYPIPVPARHLETIFEICHFSPEERMVFLAAYAAAHPNQSKGLRPAPKRAAGQHSLQIEVPVFEDPTLQHEVEQLIQEFARQVIDLTKDR